MESLISQAMNPMKIVIVGPGYPLRGGIAHFNDSFAMSLVEHGQECEVVSFYLQYPSLFFPGKSQTSKGEAPENLIVHQWLSSIDPGSWKKAARKILTLEPDVVVFRYWLPFMAPCLGTVARMVKKAGIPTLGLVDNAVPHERRLFDKPLSRFFLKQCTAFITLSESVAEDIDIMAPGRPVMTSPHPIYEFFGSAIPALRARTELNLDPDRRYVLFFGFVRAYKGLDLLIRAIGNEKVRKLGVHLIVAGEFYEEESKYVKLIDKLGLRASVIVRSDYIPENEVRNYFCAVNLVAQTYRTATQ
ncbi:MAG TPA: glycosyltransferase, partial [Cryomorphaceae bacterium]|nr:glycosyltransferase [Cryomorphaceae bacterium]